jgi:hypothetical protein
MLASGRRISNTVYADAAQSSRTFAVAILNLAVRKSTDHRRRRRAGNQHEASIASIYDPHRSHGCCICGSPSTLNVQLRQNAMQRAFLRLYA